MPDAYLKRWGLVPDGAPIVTHAAQLWPVHQGTTSAILKIATADEERRGAALLDWWQGAGAVRVLARDGDALLMERATGTRSLAAMARDGQDDDATRILCRVAGQLHGTSGNAAPRPALESLGHRFRALYSAAAQGGPFARAAEAARTLLATAQDETVLHGDLHHGNVLDFGAPEDGASDPLDGWRAIDPKGLIGERGFDYANIFTNPDLIGDAADAGPPLATDPAHFARRLDIVTAEAGLDRSRLLTWILAWTGLSAAWFLEDGHEAPAALVLQVGEMAAMALDS